MTLVEKANSLIRLSNEISLAAIDVMAECATLKTANARLEAELALCRAQRDAALTQGGDFRRQLADALEKALMGDPDGKT